MSDRNLAPVCGARAFLPAVLIPAVVALRHSGGWDTSSATVVCN